MRGGCGCDTFVQSAVMCSMKQGTVLLEIFRKTGNVPFVVLPRLILFLKEHLSLLLTQP
jgi:hypothetical protein